MLKERDFSDKPKVALNVFIASCCTPDELKEKRGEMLRAVIYAMDLPENQFLAQALKEVETEAVSRKINLRDFL